MAFSTNDLVLVTGANGHVGSHIVHLLLRDSNGPRVRAAVRAEQSAAPLRKAFEEHFDSGRLLVTYVPDMTSRQAYDRAVDGATHIAHVASPLILDPPDLENDLLKPAIGGAVGLLESASQSSSIQAVVMTSSFAAVFDPVRGWADDKIYTSEDWSPLTYEQGAGREPVHGIDPRYEGFMAYLSSKKLSEEAAWKFYHDLEPNRGADLWRFSTILPTYIGGPSVLPFRGNDVIDGYSFSQKMIVNVARKGTNRGLTDDFPFWIDVRDVALAHVQALIRPECNKKRWILACQKARMWQIATSIQTSFPEREMEVVEEMDQSFGVECNDSLAGLGMERWITLDQMVKDTIEPIVQNLE